MSDISPAERRAVSKALRRLGPLVLLLYTAGYLDRVNLGTAALTMNADLGISISAFGFATGIFSAGYIALQVPGNLALNRLGPRRWLGLLTVSWGVVAVSSSLIQGEGSLIATRIALGAVEAGMLPGMLMYLTIWFPPRMRGRVTAWCACRSTRSVRWSAAVRGRSPARTARRHARTWPARGRIAHHRMSPGAGGRRILGRCSLRFLTDSPATATWLTEAERGHWLLRDRHVRRPSRRPVDAWLAMSASRLRELQAAGHGFRGVEPRRGRHRRESPPAFR
ncbi:Putative tartrate transporter [Streptomyces antimycoticus]